MKAAFNYAHGTELDIAAEPAALCANMARKSAKTQFIELFTPYFSPLAVLFKKYLRVENDKALLILHHGKTKQRSISTLN